MRVAPKQLMLVWIAQFVLMLAPITCCASHAADDKPAADSSKLLGGWSGNWVDNWQYKGQGGKLTCTLSADKDGAVRAVFKAPGFLKDPVTVTFKLKAGGESFSSSGSVDLGKPVNVMTFTVKLSGDKFSGDYAADGEKGTFEMEKAEGGKQ